MNDFAQDLVALVQSIAIAHSTWRGSDTALADVLLKALRREGYSERDLDDVRRLLHSQPLRAALASRDVALWTGKDKLLRLVDQQPSSRKAALLRTQHHPGPTCCRYCLLREAQSLNPELQPERDARGEIIPGSSVHENCAAAFQRLRTLVESG